MSFKKDRIIYHDHPIHFSQLFIQHDTQEELQLSRTAEPK